MYGPLFIFVYILLYALAAVYIFYIAPARAARVGSAEDMALPLQPNVYELAWLRGAESELIVLLIYTLLRRDFFVLEYNKKSSAIYLALNKKQTEINALTLIEKQTVQLLSKSTQIDIFAKQLAGSTEFKKQSDGIKKKLMAESLVWSDKEEEKYFRIKKGVMFLLIIIGIYKLMAAVVHGHSNVLFIVIIAIFGSISLMNFKVKRLPTSKGKEFLKGFQEMFRPVSGEKLLNQPLYLQQLLLSLYGFHLLEASSFKSFYRNVTGFLTEEKPVFWDNTTWNTGSGGSSSGCGSSCGGSCGGGCGGGCGGCS
jgi:uncharacterized protein (TIGR04222 family)